MCHSHIVHVLEQALSRAGIEKIVKKLKQERRISRVGPDKGGHWEVLKDQQP